MPGDLTLAALRKVGLKATGPRLAILRILADDRSHPTAERIYARLRGDLPSLSLSTVYSTLETFIAAGLCRRVRSEDAHLRVDGIVGEHDHAVCSVCRRIFDVDREAIRLPAPPSSLPGGLEVRAVRVEYDVICNECRAIEKTNEEHSTRTWTTTRPQFKGGRHG